MGLWIGLIIKKYMNKTIVKVGSEYFIAGVLLTFILCGISIGLIAWIFGDKNCDDFLTQESAQKALNAHMTDIYKLDLDKDGIACDNKNKYGF